MRVFGCLELEKNNEDGMTYISCFDEVICRIRLQYSSTFERNNILKASLKNFTVSISGIQCKFKDFDLNSVTFLSIFGTSMKVYGFTTLDSFLNHIVPTEIGIKRARNKLTLVKPEYTGAVYRYKGEDVYLKYEDLSRNPQCTTVKKLETLLYRYPSLVRYKTGNPEEEKRARLYKLQEKERRIEESKRKKAKNTTKKSEIKETFYPGKYLGGIVSVSYGSKEGLYKIGLAHADDFELALNKNNLEEDLRSRLLGYQVMINDMLCTVVSIELGKVTVKTPFETEVTLSSKTSDIMLTNRNKANFSKMALRGVIRQDLCITRVDRFSFEFTCAHGVYICYFKDMKMPFNEYSLNELLDISEYKPDNKLGTKKCGAYGNVYAVYINKTHASILLFEKYPVYEEDNIKLTRKEVMNTEWSIETSIQGLNVRFDGTLLDMIVEPLGLKINIKNCKSFTDIMKLILFEFANHEGIRLTEIKGEGNIITFKYDGKLYQIGINKVIYLINEGESLDGYIKWSLSPKDDEGVLSISADEV